MKSVVVKSLIVIAFAGLGYLYYIFIGCRSGVCPITSSPFMSTGYGAVIGAFVAFAVAPAVTKKPDKD